MKRPVVLALALALVSATFVGDLAFGTSHAAAPHALLTHPAPSLGTAPVPVADPSLDPAGWGQGVLDAFLTGQYVLAIVLLLWGLDVGLVWAGGRWPQVFGWARGRAKPWLVVGASILGAVAAALSAGGSMEWRALVGAVALAITMYLAPEREPATPAEPEEPSS